MSDFHMGPRYPSPTDGIVMVEEPQAEHRIEPTVIQMVIIIAFSGKLQFLHFIPESLLYSTDKLAMQTLLWILIPEYLKSFDQTNL